MKLIGVLSDTHIRSESTRVLPPQVWEAFKNVDLILHGGDFVSQRVIDELSTLAPVLGVRGNNDYGALGNLPVSRRVGVEDVVLGMAHGDVPALGRGRVKALVDAPGNKQTGANALSHFEFDDDVSCVIFGHSHWPLLIEHQLESRKVLLLNPGSPTDKRYSPHNACALLKIDGDRIEPQLFTW